ncbi:MAG: alpha/beta-type small acid-soluble spore protein [Firmicutes bacterium]|nr:alpha/beta-type small acid-soluble spore protein [Alicyclobacillaceae bacterium]MCL6496793.1 alpha/beta-type small acid-soluble spore protein [Bacillota bacterium]
MAQIRSQLLPAAVRERFKYEVAQDLGLFQDLAERGWADMKTRDLGRIGGKIGGNMVKVLIRRAETMLADATPDELT